MDTITISGSVEAFLSLIVNIYIGAGFLGYKFGWKDWPVWIDIIGVLSALAGLALWLFRMFS